MTMFVCVFQMVLSEDVQSLVGVMLQMAAVLTDMMDKFLPAINQVQSYLVSIKDLNLVANNEFSQVGSFYYSSSLSCIIFAWRVTLNSLCVSVFSFEIRENLNILKYAIQSSTVDKRTKIHHLHSCYICNPLSSVVQ